MTQLYILADEYRAAAKALDELDLDEQTARDTLESLSGDFETKAANIAKMIRNQEILADALKSHEAQTKQRREKIEREIEHIKRYLDNCMVAAKIDAIDGLDITIKVKLSSAVLIHDLAKIPEQYLAPPKPETRSPDKLAIKKAIDNCVLVDGASLESRRNLIIK